MAASIGRLGPIYDADDLKATIDDLRTKPEALVNFFGDEPRDVAMCQGDILKIESKLPFIDEDGEAAAAEHLSGLWQILGNTCDIDRDIGDVTFAQLAPIQLFSPDSDAAVDEKLIQYKAYRCFYVPPIDALGPKHLLTDLTRPVSVHKQALIDSSERVARLHLNTWMLFHCVLVRFLARSDGRLT